MPPKVAKTTEHNLDRNHVLLFKQLLQNYEQKEYKKGVKNADVILKKYPNHGETMAMKGLILTNIDRKDEGWDCVRKGLRNDLKSHICWHVYGLLYRADRNYEESMKCYFNALKYDPDNLVVLRDLAVIQSQLRVFPGLVDTRRSLVVRQPEVRGHHTAYAVAYHLNGDFRNAEKVLRDYDEKLLIKPKNNVEHSLTCLYQNTVIAESGDTARALLHLGTIEAQVMDKLELLERRAAYNLVLEHFSESEKLYRQLLDLNPDCHRYYLGLENSCRLRATSGEIQVAEATTVYEELQAIYPRATAPRRRPLDWLSGEDFKSAMDKYLRSLLQKGVPSTFVDIKALYKDSQKADIIEHLARSCLSEFGRSTKTLNGSEEHGDTDSKASEIEAPTSYLWALYFLAQSYDHRHDLANAMSMIDQALDHTPTLVELHLTKARILKHSGSPALAAEQMNVARELDLQDRFINTKASKYFLRAEHNGEAIATISLFLNATLGGGSIGDLQEMQSVSFILEDGLSYARQSILGLALKRFENVKKSFDQWYEDEFDFHQYCFRKGTIDAYMSSMRWEDSIYLHPVYKRMAKAAVRALIDIHQQPDLKSGPIDRPGMSDSDRKKEKKKIQKIRARCSKDATRESEKKDGVDMHRKLDTDPVGDKLLNTSTPIEDAFIYLRPWLDRSPADLQALLLAIELHIEQKDYAKAVEYLKQVPTRLGHALQFKLRMAIEETSATDTQVAEYLDSIFSSLSLLDWNEQYLNTYASTAELLSGLQIARVLKCDNVWSRISQHKLEMESTTLEEAREMLHILEDAGTSEQAEEYWVRIKEVWTLAERTR